MANNFLDYEGLKHYDEKVKEQFSKVGADLDEVLKVVPHTAAITSETSNTTVFLDTPTPSTEIFGNEYGTIFTHKRKYNGKLYDEGYNQLLKPSDYLATHTTAGVTVTNNGDGTVTLNGTVTEGTQIFFAKNIPFKGGRKVAFLPSGVLMNVVAADGSVVGLKTSGIIELSDEVTAITLYISPIKGTVYNEQNFAPIVCDITYFESATSKTIATIEDWTALYPDFMGYVPIPSSSTPVEIVPSGSTSKIISKSVNMLRKEKYGEPLLVNDAASTVNIDGTVDITLTITEYQAAFSLGSYTFKTGHKYLMLGGLADVEPDGIRVGFVNETAYQDSGAGRVFIWPRSTQEKEVSVILPSGTYSSTGMRNTYTIKPMIVDLTEINLTSINTKEAWLAKFAEYYEGFEKETTLNYTAADSSKQSAINNALSFNGKISEMTKQTLLTSSKKMILDGTENWFKINGDHDFMLAISQVDDDFGLSNAFEFVDGLTPGQSVAKEAFFSMPNGGEYIFFRSPAHSTVEEWKAYLSAQYAAGTPVYVHLANLTAEQIAIQPLENAIPTIAGQPTIVESQAIEATNAPVIMDFTNYIVSKLNKVYGLLKDNQGNLIVPYAQSNMLYDEETDAYLSDLLPFKCNTISREEGGVRYNGYYFDDGSITEIKRRQVLEVDTSALMWEGSKSGEWGLGTLTIGNPSAGTGTIHYYALVSCTGINSTTGKMRYVVREVVPANNPTAKSVRTVDENGNIAWEELNYLKNPAELTKNVDEYQKFVSAIDSLGNQVKVQVYGSSPSAGTIALRRSNGEVRVGTPLADTDATNKKYVHNNFVDKLRFSNLEQALKGYILDTADDKYSNMTNSAVMLHNSVTVGGNVYPIANGTRMLVSKIEGKTAKMVQLLNKENFPATYTESGVTITNNGDGTLTVNGTATANISIYLGTQAVAPIGTKWLVYDGGAGVGRINGYTTFINSSVGELAFTKQDNSRNIYTATTKYTISAYIFIAKDTSVTNVTFKPQLFNLTAMYGVGNEPTTTNEFLSDFPKLYGYENGNIYPTKITGLKVDGFVGSDYYSESIDLVRGKTLDETYELHGFGGVCDTFEITKNEADDLYTLTKVQRIKKLVLNGTEVYEITAGRIIGSYDAIDIAMVVSNKYLYDENVDSGIAQSISPRSFQYYITDTRFETVDAWKAHLAEQYAAGDPVVIYHKMTTPIETVIFSNLTYEQVTLLYYNNLLFYIEGNTNDDYTSPTITNTVVCKLTATEA